MNKKQSGIFIGIMLIIIFFTVVNTFSAEPSKVSNSKKTVIIPILIYHRIIPKTTSIYDFSPTMLENHIQFFLAHGYQPITAAQFIEYQKRPELFPDKPLILTFDDGNKSHYSRAFPLLKKYGLKATFFIYPSIIKDQSKVFLTWSELKEMTDAGMDIECHSMNHPYLTLSKTPQGDNSSYLKWLNRQLLVSKALLEYKLERRITLLAYPYGWFDHIVESVAINAGYQGIFTVNWGQNLPTENPFRVKRRVMDNTMRLVDIERSISTQPLEIEVISPDEAGIITDVPIIKFRLKNSGIKIVSVSVRKNKANLTPDKQGIYTFKNISKLKPGYCMIIVSGYDQEKHFYMGSWGFNYQISNNSSIPSVLPEIKQNKGLTPTKK